MHRDEDGHDMTEEQYSHLVSLVRPDAEATAALLGAAGLRDAAAWMANWEREWQRNLRSCKPGGLCRIMAS